MCSAPGQRLLRKIFGISRYRRAAIGVLDGVGENDAETRTKLWAGIWTIGAGLALGQNFTQVFRATYPYFGAIGFFNAVWEDNLWMFIGIVVAVAPSFQQGREPFRAVDGDGAVIGQFYLYRENHFVAKCRFWAIG